MFIHAPYYLSLNLIPENYCSLSKVENKDRQTKTTNCMQDVCKPGDLIVEYTKCKMDIHCNFVNPDTLAINVCVRINDFSYKNHTSNGVY